MKKTVALHNLGCKVNAYELEAIQQLHENRGYEIVPFAPGADVYIINDVYRDEHCGPKIAADAAQSEKDESRCGCRGLRLLCAGGWEKTRRGYGD